MPALSIRFLALFTIAVWITGCQSAVINTSGVELPKEVKPISIQVASGNIQAAQSMRTSVKQYRGNSRDGKDLVLSSEYRLAIRLQNGKVLTRFDRPGKEYPDGLERTIINDGDFVTMLLPGGQVFRRTPITAPGTLERISLSPDIGLYNRVNTDALTASFRKLNFRTEPGNKASEITLVAPPETLASSFGGQKALSYSITIDTELGAVTNTKVEYQTNPDEKLTLNTSTMYSVKDGLPVQVGKILEEKHTFVSKIDITGLKLPPADPDTTPILTRANLDRIEAEGGTVREVARPSLNPASKDYTLTTVEVYEDLQINAAPESLFRVTL